MSSKPKSIKAYAVVSLQNPTKISFFEIYQDKDFKIDSKKEQVYEVEIRAVKKLEKK